MSTDVLLFWVFSILALSGALGVVLLRDPVKGALSLIACFFVWRSFYGMRIPTDAKK